MPPACMALASQAAVSALEARREVRAGRPAASRHWNSPAHRSVWSRGVPRVLVHRKKGTDKPRLRSRCALRRSPPLAPCARALNSLVARRARAGCSHRRLGCHRAREVLPSPSPRRRALRRRTARRRPRHRLPRRRRRWGRRLGRARRLLRVLRALRGSCPAHTAALAALAPPPKLTRGAPHAPHPA